MRSSETLQHCSVDRDTLMKKALALTHCIVFIAYTIVLDEGLIVTRKVNEMI